MRILAQVSGSPWQILFQRFRKCGGCCQMLGLLPENGAPVLGGSEEPQTPPGQVFANPEQAPFL